MPQPKPVLRPQGKYENIFEFTRRVEAQKRCSYSIPPKGKHETWAAFYRRMDACKEEEPEDSESEDSESEDEEDE